jgi:hypothetical protein
MAIIFYQRNSGTLQVIGLMSTEYENDATLTATLYDEVGHVVPDFADVAGVYVGGSNGNYTFPVPPSFNPPAGGNYMLVISATTIEEVQGYWQIPVVVATR